jgi:predicted dinucleotide-binding enzyme
MTTVGFIGSGNIGGTVARLAVASGYDVVLSNSRGPETLTDLAEELGPRASVGTTADATAADIVVLSIPLKAYRDLSADALAGKLVLETLNYYPARDGQIAELDDGSRTSSELVQAHLADSRVVKVFNNIFWGHLASMGTPSGSPDRTALPIAGDDVAAKASATAFLDAIGYDAVDVGELSESWRFEPDHPAYGTVYFAPGADGDATEPDRMPPSRPASADDVRRAIAAAER